MTREREIATLPRGLRRRTLPTARLAARAGVKHLLRLAGRKPRPKDPATAIVAAGTLVEDLGAFKGLFMKFGQMASYLSSAPTAADEVMARLQANGTAFAFEPLERIVEEDLGAAPATLFGRIDRRPLASASIGQVHRARLGGREVAVKIQYPGIEEALRADLAVLSPLARLGCVGGPIDARSLLDELRDRVREECDYRIEARNQALFGRLLRDVPRCRVPAVVPERSGRRVLTSEFSPAAEYRTFRATADRAARNRAAETILRACFDGLFRHCVYNADPQPANYLFDEDGSVTFLDFGCVRRFEPSMIATSKRLARAILDGDPVRFRREFTALGFVPNPKRFDWDHEWRAFRHLYTPFLERGPWTYTRAFVAESYELMVYRNPNVLRTAVPREWLMLQRLQFGGNAVLADLGAEGRWGDILRDALDAEIVPAAEEPPVRRAPAARHGAARDEVRA